MLLQTSNKREEFKRHFLCLSSILITISIINCKSLPENNVLSSTDYWRPIRTTHLNAFSMNVSNPNLQTSESSNSPVTGGQRGFALSESKNQSCHSIFREQLLEFLANIENPELFLKSIKNQVLHSDTPAASNQTPVNVIRQIVNRSSRELKDDHMNDISSVEDEEDASIDDESDPDQPEVGSIQKSTDTGSASELYDSSSNKQDILNQTDGTVDSGPGSKDEQAPDENQLRKEQEAAERSEAEVADSLALDEQQQQQRDIIQAQAEHEAKAIKEQQELLLKQQKLQQQMVLQKDRNDLRPNHSQSVASSSVVNRDNTQGANLYNKQIRVRGSGVKFAEQQAYGVAVKPEHRAIKGPMVDFASQPELIQEENKQKFSSILSLVPLEANHHYGPHYGGLHKHQSHYYQYAESHKKGQFKSGYKRGNKKFRISGHSSQDKNYAEGHVKWKGKKGKGTHYWELKHKGKPKKYHYYDHHY